MQKRHRRRVDLIRRTLELARNAVKAGDEPFGALITIDDLVVAEAENHVLRTRDPTRHAELEVIRMVLDKVGAAELSRGCLYSSTEPCVMCAGAIYWCDIQEIVFGCSLNRFRSLRGNGMNFGARAVLSKSGVEIIGPVLEDEAFELHALFWPDVASDDGHEEPGLLEMIDK